MFVVILILSNTYVPNKLILDNEINYNIHFDDNRGKLKNIL